MFMREKSNFVFKVKWSIHSKMEDKPSVDTALK